jgi:hypothetical protein
MAEPEPTLRDALPAIEFCCWVVVFLAPFLRWVNGPAVTTDQFVVQCTLVSLALTGAVGLRIYAIARRRSESSVEGPSHTPEKDDEA